MGDFFLHQFHFGLLFLALFVLYVLMFIILQFERKPLFLESALLQEEVASAWAPLGLQVEKEVMGLTLFWR